MSGSAVSAHSKASESRNRRSRKKRFLDAGEALHLKAFFCVLRYRKICTIKRWQICKK